MFLLRNNRFWIDLLIFVVVFVGPWWVSFTLALVAAFYFRRFVELVILGIVLDSLYTGPVAWFTNFPYALTLISFLLLLGIRYVKTFLRPRY